MVLLKSNVIISNLVLSSNGLVSKAAKKSESLTGLLRKTIESSGKSGAGLSTLIQAMKSKAISSLLTSINAKTGMNINQYFCE